MHSLRGWKFNKNRRESQDVSGGWDDSLFVCTQLWKAVFHVHSISSRFTIAASSLDKIERLGASGPRWGRDFRRVSISAYKRVINLESASSRWRLFYALRAGTWPGNSAMRLKTPSYLASRPPRVLFSPIPSALLFLRTSRRPERNYAPASWRIIGSRRGKSETVEVTGRNTALFLSYFLAERVRKFVRWWLLFTSFFILKSKYLLTFRSFAAYKDVS